MRAGFAAPGRRRCWFLHCGLAALAALAAVAPAAAAPRTVGASEAGLGEEARRVAPGEELVVEGLWLERDAAPVALELERVAVWAPGAVVEIDGERRPAPAGAVFRGRARGWKGSVAVLTVGESGEADGLVLREGRAWVLGGRGDGLAALEADLEGLDKPFACGNEDAAFRRLAGAARGMAVDAGLAAVGTPLPGRATAASHAAVPYTATLALETDYEYYRLFLGRADPVAAALDYLATLVAYADLVYSREIDTAMEIGYARLWTGGATADPWTASNTLDVLFQLQDYWNLNMRSVARTAVHMVSGKSLGGGVAYVGSLCEGYLFPGGSYDYGVSASISGGFSWNGDPTTDPAAVVWDVMVVLHEIGHNFDSPHSHDYCGLGGSSQAIDRCYSSQACGTAAAGLPSCSSPSPHFAGGAGTIMSYCHLQGGMHNVALTFGEEHTCGVLPWREADRMSAHVAARAAGSPACFAGSAPPCPADGSEEPGAHCDSGCPVDLTLSSQTVTTTASFKAESQIAAGDGFTVAATGNVMLQAGGTIALGDGFSVASGGRLRVAAGSMPSCP